MPRIGYQAGSDRSEWYTIERLLRKYASIYGVKIFVYVPLHFLSTRLFEVLVSRKMNYVLQLL